jgi:hypothetical protein
MTACPSCRRPVPLTAEEIVTLRAADASVGGIPCNGISPAVLRTLVRMGYLMRAANDDGARCLRAVITERGRSWLAGQLT